MNRFRKLGLCVLALSIVALIGVSWGGKALSNEESPQVSGTWIMETSITYSGGAPDCICGPNCNNSFLGQSGTFTFDVQQSGSSFYSDSWLPHTFSGTIDNASIIFSFILPDAELSGCGDYVDFNGELGDHVITGSFSGHDCIYNCVWAGNFNVTIVSPPVASLAYSPECSSESPFVYEEVTFNASDSIDPDGEIVDYSWDFGDGDSAKGEIVTHTYAEDGEYTIVLAVTDDDDLGNNVSQSIEVKDFDEGDLLFGYGIWAVPGFWSHCGMYIGNRQVIHSHERAGQDGKSGVDTVTLEWWMDTYRTWAAYCIRTAGEETITPAIQWATASERLDDPYDWCWAFKQRHGEHWYCSEFVWAAYYNASDGRINIEDGPDLFGITPDEIINDAETELLVDHRETSTRAGFLILTKCLVDLAIVDPDGLSVNKQVCEVDGASYGEDDFDGDGEVEDWIGIPEAKVGDYSILVMPEPDASPQDTYSLKVSSGNVSIMLADNVQISDIPNQSYIVKSTEMGIEQIIPPEGCFIATAAYGTQMAMEIEILREFRDKYLLTSPLGQALVDFYYKVSPPIAEFITEHPSLKPIVRVGLLPAVALSNVAVNTTPAEKTAIVGLLVLLSVAVAVQAARRRGRGAEYTRG